MRNIKLVFIFVLHLNVVNAQSVVEVLGPVPYRYEDTRIENINVLPSSGCSGPRGYNRGGYTAKKTMHYISDSWESIDDARRKIDIDFESDMREKTTTLTNECGYRSKIRVLTGLYRRFTKITGTPTYECPGQNTGLSFPVAQPVDQKEEYIYGESYATYEKIKEQKEGKEYEGYVGSCTYKGEVWGEQLFRETSVFWEGPWSSANIKTETYTKYLK